jgi:hypothetical protein
MAALKGDLWDFHSRTGAYCHQDFHREQRRVPSRLRFQVGRRLRALLWRAV